MSLRCLILTAFSKTKVARIFKTHDHCNSADHIQRSHTEMSDQICQLLSNKENDSDITALHDLVIVDLQDNQKGDLCVKYISRKFER